MFVPLIMASYVIWGLTHTGSNVFLHTKIEYNARIGRHVNAYNIGSQNITMV